MRDPIDIVAEELLTQIEKKENKLLEWGIIGGSVDAEQEIFNMLRQPPTQLIQNLLEQHGLSEKKTSLVIQNLMDRKLIFPLSNGQYRSRYSETVRLLYLLKQRFNFEDWKDAPNLISNIKPFIQYREYPKRDIDFLQIMDCIKHFDGELEFRKDIINALLDDGKMLLSKFQLESLDYILTYQSKKKDQGVVIGAGTGSGKTKAFYLPAFIKVMDAIRQDKTPWTKVLAIYPRVELLKDQYKEALTEIHKLNNIAKKHGIRPITIGCYYANTPENAEEIINKGNRRWKKTAKGYESPFFSCPTCGGKMVWIEEDVQKEIREGLGKYERLVCIEQSCGHVIDSENIMLTRHRIKSTPPDFLFTTTEMLNRKMTNTKDWNLFGINAIQPPLFLLLDEIHIYDGILGANVAYLLRRWRHLVSKTQKASHGMQVVGLSATLSNPIAFFSQLSGLSQKAINYITPKSVDMVTEGAEYNLIIRGDSFSSTTLLSTTVQTAMLMGRMLDPLHCNVSKNAFGSKVFGFTDKLDVLNRWYHIELDAEKKLVLSQYRDRELFENYLLQTVTEQHMTGQIWEFAKKIDSDSLIHPLEIDLSSSQNKGVNDKAKFVVATSALEVGYNDVKVGAVLQHKSPRNIASFLQRKGRSGRIRGMRPWTIVITSAYGRDRFVYDYPEHLFNPVLDNLYLPLQNQYVQRIQSAFALMDWLTWKLSQGGQQTDTRLLLTSRGNKQLQTYIRNLLLQLLQGDETEFIEYLSQVLHLGTEQIEQLLWLPPRSLYMELFPTLINLLQTQFEEVSVEEQKVPLSGFVPRALFESLHMSNLEICLPDGRKENMPMVQALNEYAPGNVSKRYVNAYRKSEAHWIPINSERGLDLKGQNVRSRVLDEVEEEGKKLVICEPYAFKLEQIPFEIRDQSQALLDWRVKFNPFSSSTLNYLSLPNHNILQKMFKEVSYFTSDENSYVRIIRYAPLSKATVKYKRGSTETKIVPFHYKGRFAALGFEQFVDAIRFSIKDLEPDKLFNLSEWKEMEKSARPEYYFYVTQHDQNLIRCLNIFQIQWLSQIVLSSVIAIAISQEISIPEAVKVFKTNHVRISQRTLEVIFHSTVVKVKESEHNRDNEPDKNKRYNELLGFIQDQSLMEIFISHLSIFTIDLREQESFIIWIKETLIATAGASIQKTIEDLLPDVNTNDLVLDINGSEIWFSETESGGVGIVTKVVSVLKNKLAKFETLFAENLENCSRHYITSSLRTILPKITAGDFSLLLDKIRKETRIDQQKELLLKLQQKIDQIGISPRREVVISFATNFLRGKGTRELDLLRQELHQLWHEEEERLQCKIDSYVFAVASINREGSEDKISAKVDSLLQNISFNQISEKQRFLLIESLLLNDCINSCSECLVLYSPFRRFIKPSRILLSYYLPKPYKVVNYKEKGWEERIYKLLYKGERVLLITDDKCRVEVQRDLFGLLQKPVNFDYEIYYPYVEKVKHKGLTWKFYLRIREMSYE